MAQAMNKTFEQKSSAGVVLNLLAANRGLRHAFGTKKLTNEKRLAQAVDQQGIPVVSVHQVHGDGILVVDRSTEDWIAALKKMEAPRGTEGYDAIVTDQPGVILAVRTADCLPVLMFDPRQRVIAAVHAGWRGALCEVVPKTVRCMMDRFSSQPQTLVIGIGPSIRSCCYEVGEMVLAPLAARYSDWRGVVKESGDKKAVLNLQELIRRQLLELGAPADQIEIAQACTACDHERFFSYRRDGKRAGSMWSGIVMEAA